MCFRLTRVFFTLYMCRTVVYLVCADCGARAVVSALSALRVRLLRRRERSSLLSSSPVIALAIACDCLRQGQNAMAMARQETRAVKAKTKFAYSNANSMLDV